MKTIIAAAVAAIALSTSALADSCRSATAPCVPTAAPASVEPNKPGVRATAAELEAWSRAVPPQAEVWFVASVDKWRKTYAAGANDMAKGAARPARARDICALMKYRGAYKVAGWIGTVKTLSSNNDGLGVLSVEVGDDIALKTWNNSVSDASDHTLIDPTSIIFHKASSMKVGQKVVITGTFIPSQTDCFREGSMTLAGSLESPEYIFQFFDIAAVN
jgi:hypothetical protein